MIGLCAVVAACLASRIAGASDGDLLKVGDVAPKLQTGAWVQGEPVGNFEKGKVYLVEFWATWCRPCLANVPHLNELHQTFKNKGLVVIGQNVWEGSAANVPKVVQREKMSYRIALDDIKESEAGTLNEKKYFRAYVHGCVTVNDGHTSVDVHVLNPTAVPLSATTPSIRFQSLHAQDFAVTVFLTDFVDDRLELRAGLFNPLSRTSAPGHILVAKDHVQPPAGDIIDTSDSHASRAAASTASSSSVPLNVRLQNPALKDSLATEFFIDGKKTEASRSRDDDSALYTVSNLAPGKRVVEVKHPNYETWRSSVALSDVRGTSMEVRLVPKPATLTVEVTPRVDFMLNVNGGRATRSGGQFELPAERDLALEIRAKGYDVATRTLRLPANGHDEWRVTLEPARFLIQGRIQNLDIKNPSLAQIKVDGITANVVFSSRTALRSLRSPTCQQAGDRWRSHIQITSSGKALPRILTTPVGCWTSVSFPSTEHLSR